MHHEILGELRARLHDIQTEQGWANLCIYLGRLPDDTAVEPILRYLQTHLDAWPSVKRTLPNLWMQALHQGHAYPWLALVRRIDFDLLEHPDTVHDLRRLAACEHLTGLRELYFHTRGHQVSGWAEILLQAPWVTQLTHLEIRECYLNRQILQELLESGALDQLQALLVERGDFNRLYSDDIPRQRQILHLLPERFHQLRKLSFLNCRLSQDDAPALQQLLPRLHALDLSHNDYHSFNLLHLLREGSRIHQREHPDTPLPLQKLALNSFPHLAFPTHRYNVMRAITELTALANLTGLALAHHKLRDDSIRELCQAPRLRNLVALDLRDNLLTDAAAFALAHCSHLSNLRYLDLQGNDITSVGRRALAESPYLDPFLKRDFQV